MVKVSRENQQVIEKNLSNQNKGRKKTFKFCNQQGDGYVSWCDIWSVRIQPVALTHHFLLLRRVPAPRTSLCGCALNQLGKVTAFTKNICLGECCCLYFTSHGKLDESTACGQPGSSGSAPLHQDLTSQGITAWVLDAGCNQNLACTEHWLCPRC